MEARARGPRPGPLGPRATRGPRSARRHLRRLARGPGRDREDRAAAGRASGGHPLDGPRAPRRRGRPLLRGHARRGSAPRRLVARRGPSRPRLRLLIRACRPGARGRLPATPNGTASTRTRRPSRGRASTCPASSSAVAPGPAAGLPRRRPSTSCVAISIWSHFGESGRGQVARGDASHHPPRRPARAVDARTAVRRALREHRRALRRRSSPRSAARCIGADSGSRRSSGRRATGASSTSSGAPRSSRRNGWPVKRCPRGRSSIFAVGQNADNQDMFVLRRR